MLNIASKKGTLCTFPVGLGRKMGCASLSPDLALQVLPLSNPRGVTLWKDLLEKQANQVAKVQVLFCFAFSGFLLTKFSRSGGNMKIAKIKLNK